LDTGSHLLFGATLAGLAMLDPVIAGQPELFRAVLTVTLVGSHAPDFDSVARLKSYAAYIRTHRGITHSLPALAVWPCVLTVPTAALFNVWEHAAILFLWSFVAVLFHVALDWMNAYGVQCFRPLSARWHHMDVLALFEPFLFALHGAGLLIWLLADIAPGSMFMCIYGITVAYIGIRALHHHKVIGMVHQELGLHGICHVLPGFHWFRWQFVLETESNFYTGTIDGKKVTIKDVYAKEESHSAIQATLTTDGVRAFLYFAQRVHVTYKVLQDGYMVEWRDVRFWHNHKLPFGVDVRLDHNLKVLDQSLGWRKKAWDPPFV
jgi:inner membrane protein